MSLESDDVLIDRVIDRPGDESAWQELETAAASEPALWRRVAETHRAGARIALAADAVRSLAERVPLPRVAATASATLRRWLPRIAVAAALMAAAIAADRAVLCGSDDDPVSIPDPDFDTAIARCLEDGERAGRVLRTLPELVVEQRPAMTGPGVEVVYVRRILERRILPAVYELTHDERGMPVASPVAPERLRPAESF